MSGAVASATTISIRTRLIEVDEWLKPFAHYWSERMQALDAILDEEER